jgi:peroxiredoxin
MHNPLVPESLEGWSLLHLMYRLKWDELRALSDAERSRLADEAVAAIAAPGLVTDAASVGAPESGGPTAFAQMLGHKADLMVTCFRRSFEGLAASQLAWSRSGLARYLEPTTSYVSIVELGMYEMTGKLHEQLAARHKPGSEEFERAFDAEMETQRQRVASRLWADVPAFRYVCFYPMNKRRGETVNWYGESFERRALMMREHGMIGRHYAGKVTQIISGSIGYDDWEWGVDLYAPDPLVFKKLIYEMRFDEASAKFAEFGPFYTGVQFAPSQLAALLAGNVPSLD